MTKEEEILLANPFIFKEGRGTASNACYWRVCYDQVYDIYTAELSFGGYGKFSLCAWI